MMAYFSNKLAFITGGSSGIGLATANLLASQGCSLVLMARGKPSLDKACKYIEARIDKTLQSVNTLSMDVADNNDVQEKIKLAVEKFGIPGILINSAGVGSGDYFENISYEQFDRAMKINVYGTRNTVSAILPFMKQKGGGHIVNISSVAGLIGMFGYSLYSTTKYALVGFSECLRSELKRFNITVTLVCPPEVKTPFIEEEAKTLPPEARIVKNLAGLLTPEQAAQAIVRGIKRKKFLVVPGIMAKSLLFWHRVSNGLLTRLPSDIIIKFASRISIKK
ncbi:MAG: short-chain dehydrogenase [Deltaproteobacteria bacterium HGW-Deltaproteobacteria-13]|jgi:short-subunit dehydrogenase|nr:MAG: short-chain dehydrogenase [Deltaproteobacteria bacterium HGW-Deltaproteobacteria-13]